jgi:hypothetical protein
MISDYVNIYCFVGAFIVGLIYTYLTNGKPEIIVKYPTPQNAGHITYRDDAGVCYRYKVKEVKCPINHKDIKDMPIAQK